MDNFVFALSLFYFPLNNPLPLATPLFPDTSDLQDLRCDLPVDNYRIPGDSSDILGDRCGIPGDMGDIDSSGSNKSQVDTVFNVLNG